MKDNEIELIGDDRFDENGLTGNPTEEELKQHKLWMEWIASDDFYCTELIVPF